MTAATGLTRTTAVSRAAAIGLIATAVLIGVAVAVPGLTGWVVYGDGFPPLHGSWDPRVGPGTPAAVVLGVCAVALAPRAARWRWWALQLTVFLTSIAWMVSLAAVDGWAGLGAVLDNSYEYLRTARSVTDVGELLREFVSRIPFSAAPDNWPVHVAGHPPGALLFFVMLVRLGLGEATAVGLAVVVIAATTPVAVGVTLRRLGAEAAARRAAPFLVIGPAAIWTAVSADAVFAAVAAWALCLLAIAATSRGRLHTALWAVAAGILFGCCAMLSYGLPLVGLLALGVLILTRSWRMLPWAALGGVAVLAGFALGGFAWWEAFPVLTKRYWDGDASSRPGAYWVWGNLAAVAVSAGPLVGSGIAVSALEAGRAVRAEPPNAGMDARARGVIAVLALAACACVLVADLSQMSRGEVERIWLPFVPWLLVGTALLPPRWRAGGLAGQAAFAIVVQHLLQTGW